MLGRDAARSSFDVSELGVGRPTRCVGMQKLGDDLRRLAGDMSMFGGDAPGRSGDVPRFGSDGFG